MKIRSKFNLHFALKYQFTNFMSDINFEQDVAAVSFHE